MKPQGFVNDFSRSSAALLENVQGEIAARPLPASARNLSDPLDAVAQGVLWYLTAATEPQNKRILLLDGPAVIGWRKWREIDDRIFGAGARAAVVHILGPGASAREVAAIEHLLMGAVMEAALVCAVAENPNRTARDMANGLRRLLAGLSRA